MSIILKAYNLILGIDSRKPDVLLANIKDADQPLHLHSLGSAFVIRLLKSKISKLASCKNFNVSSSLCI